MRSLEHATLLFASLPLIASRVVEKRVEDYRDEVVVALECSKYATTGDTVTPKGAADFLWYFQNVDAVVNDTQDLRIIDKIIVDVPSMRRPDWHVDWLLATETNPITGRFEKLGRSFYVHSLAAEGDNKTHVTGVAGLGGIDMRCYTEPKRDLTFTDKEGMRNECKSKYLCTRQQRKMKRTHFEISAKEITVQIMGLNPLQLPDGVKQDERIGGLIDTAFYRLEGGFKLGEGPVFDYYIDPQNEKHKISFDVQQTSRPGDGDYDETRIPAIADHLRKKLTPQILKTAKKTGCQCDFSKGCMCYYDVTFPSFIRVTVETGDQETLSFSPQDTIEITIAEDKKAQCGKGAAFAKTLSGLFGGLGELKLGGYSAVAKGLGGIFGGIYAAGCLMD